AGKGELSPRGALWDHFLDRYFPYTPPAGEKPSTASSDASAVTGRYISSRRSQTNFLKVSGMLDQVTVTRDEKGDIKVDALRDFGGHVKSWQPIGPLLYRDSNGESRIAFRRDEHGRLQLVPNFPAMVYQRTSVLQDRKYNQPVLIGSLVIMALT